ncbi:FKBP-type peptidyl-prolyl cis-trans isomerase [bacterium]|nr:FKBP-type peptidyl-prolyl cis-trans isomerase [bacterium]NBX71736.1 FKBP-type peptidyl-prolyl cis-trans isomerase [bacterium]
MKIIKKSVTLFFLGLGTSLLIANETQQRLSYAIGVEVTKPIIKENINIDKQAFLDGVNDSLSGGDLKMTDQDIKSEIAAFVEQMMQKKEKELKSVAERNKKEGEDFLTAHKKEKGIITLPSGIQYKVLQASSTSKHPGPKDTVTTHYRGTLIDGTQFDSSYDRGEPVKFGLDQVIAGWTEVLQLMSPGDKWQVIIPSDLAYGQYAPSPVIGPNKTLIFDIELLDYEAAKA